MKFYYRWNKPDSEGQRIPWKPQFIKSLILSAQHREAYNILHLETKEFCIKYRIDKFHNPLRLRQWQQASQPWLLQHTSAQKQIDKNSKRN